MLSRAGKHSWFRVGVGVGHLDGAQPRWEAPLYHGHAATWVLTLTLTLALTLPLALALTLALALALTCSMASPSSRASGGESSLA